MWLQHDYQGFLHTSSGFISFFCLEGREGERKGKYSYKWIFVWTFKKKDEERYTQQRVYSSVVEHLTAEKVCVCVCVCVCVNAHTYTHQALNVGFSNVTSEDVQGDSFLIHFCTVFLGITGIFYICNLQRPIRLKNKMQIKRAGIHQHWHKYSKINYNVRNISKLN